MFGYIDILVCLAVFRSRVRELFLYVFKTYLNIIKCDIFDIIVRDKKFMVAVCGTNDIKIRLIHEHFRSGEESTLKFKALLSSLFEHGLKLRILLDEIGGQGKSYLMEYVEIPKSLDSTLERHVSMALRGSECFKLYDISRISNSD